MREEQKGEPEVAVAAIERFRMLSRRGALLCLSLLALGAAFPLVAAVLPEDAAEVLYHNYDGGGMKIDGPSLLVRKNVGDQFSLTANYYVDSISAASVDVVATASEYKEERTEYSAGVDFLNDKTLMSLGYTNSTENDFEANTVHFSVSQDMFGDLTTLTMGVAKGWDSVRMVGNDTFSDEVDRNNYQLGVTQVLTRNLLLGLSYETITDEGFLNNPYRQVRYLDPENTSKGYSYQAEIYPRTRTSNAFAIRSLYYLPYRASFKAEYRYFNDTWGIRAHSFELGYVHPLKDQWILEGRYRLYAQDKAEFYSDLFDFRDAQSFLARDKELSTFTNNTFGGGVTYLLGQNLISGIEKGEVSLLIDYMVFNYDDFRDVTQSGFEPGSEPLYEFDAIVTRLYMTLNY